MAIGAVKALFKGWGLALRYPQILIAKWGLNVVGSLAIIIPFWRLIEEEWGQRAAAADLVGGMTLHEALRFQASNDDALLVYFWFCLLVVGIVVLLNLGLTAVALKLYSGNLEKSSARAFLTDLFPLGAVCLLIIGLWTNGLWYLGGLVDATGSPTMAWLMMGLGGLFVWLGWTLFDIARVMVCIEPLWPGAPASLRPLTTLLEGPIAVVKALSLIMRYPGTLLLGLLTAACLTLVWWFQARLNIGFDGGGSIWQPLLFLQVILFLRTFVVMGSLGSQMSYLRDKGEILGETATLESTRQTETESEFDFGLPQESS